MGFSRGGSKHLYRTFLDAESVRHQMDTLKARTSSKKPARPSRSSSGSFAKAFQTKGQRTKAIVKSNSPITTFYDSTVLREYLIKSARKGKKDILDYLAQPNRTNELIDLITSKGTSKQLTAHFFLFRFFFSF